MTADIPQKVLVSVVDEKSHFFSDMELPTNMPISDLSRGILILLREYEPKKYFNCSFANLWVGDIKLKDTQTLASAGVWDGSTIRLKISTLKINT